MKTAWASEQDGAGKGAKAFGIEALARMNELASSRTAPIFRMRASGIFVKYSKKPFVRLHSNAKALCGIYANLTDEMLRALAKRAA